MKNRKLDPKSISRHATVELVHCSARKLPVCWPASLSKRPCARFSLIYFGNTQA